MRSIAFLSRFQCCQCLRIKGGRGICSGPSDIESTNAHRHRLANRRVTSCRVLEDSRHASAGATWATRRSKLPCICHHLPPVDIGSLSLSLSRAKHQVLVSTYLLSYLGRYKILSHCKEQGTLTTHPQYQGPPNIKANGLLESCEYWSCFSAAERAKNSRTRYKTGLVLL